MTDLRQRLVQARRARQPTAAELRARIDSGATGDKVPGSDPVAAPLGTDDEAAGTPPDPASVAPALQTETAQGTARPAPGFIPAPRDSIAPNPDPQQPRGNFWFAVLAVVIALGIVYLIWLARR
jgi:hypothetical protein